MWCKYTYYGQYTRENENRMAGCALPIFAVGQYNRWCCQTFDNISLQNAVEQKSYQRHLQISHDIHLTEKQVLMKAKLIHYDQFANRCLSQPFTALVSNGEKFCKSRRVSYDVTGDDGHSASNIFSTPSPHTLHKYRSSCLVFDSA